jgi:hypothetical protein
MGVRDRADRHEPRYLLMIGVILVLCVLDCALCSYEVYAVRGGVAMSPGKHARRGFGMGCRSAGQLLGARIQVPFQLTRFLS